MGGIEKMYKYKTGMENVFLAMQICRPTTITLIKSGAKWLLRKTFWKKEQPNDAYHKRGMNKILSHRKSHQYSQVVRLFNFGRGIL